MCARSMRLSEISGHTTISETSSQGAPNDSPRSYPPPPCGVLHPHGCCCVAVGVGIRDNLLGELMTREELTAAVVSLQRVGGIYDLIAACVERDGAGRVTS